MRSPLHTLIVVSTDVLILVGIVATAWLISMAADGNGVAVLVGLITLLVTHRSQIVRHFCPAPEFEADPAPKEPRQ
ncbi:MAG: hypothetical protein SNJ79_01320 [Sphingomonadaceae bacterium]